MSTISFTAGRLLCRPIRKGLERMKFQGLDIQWMESGGLIEREFTVKGADSQLRIVKKAIEAWAVENNL